MLLTHGANAYEVASEGNAENVPGHQTPFHTARSREIVETLFNHSPGDLCEPSNIKSQSSRESYHWCNLGLTPLHSAQTADVVEIWIDHGFDINQKNTNSNLVKGTTPLHEARASDIAQTLIQHGANVDSRTEDGLTPLHTARSVGVAQVLLDNGADLDATDNQGRSPLHTLSSWEVSYFHQGDVLALARFLLNQGLDVNSRDYEGRTPLHLAMEITKEDCLSAPYRAKGYEGITIPMWGEPCIYNTDLAEFLIANGADVNAQDKHGHTPLFYASHRSGNTPGAARLINAGADVNIRDNRDNTPLLWAVDLNERKQILSGSYIPPKVDVTFLRLLLDSGANINARNQNESTALQAVQPLNQEFYGDLKKFLKQREAKK